MTKPITLLQISRPGFWLLNLWAYLGPTGQRWHLLWTPMFWFGIAYVLLPLNFLIFGLNDLSDVEIDAENPRKGNLIFGPKLPKAVLVDALKTAFWLNLACLGIILCIVDAPGYFFAIFVFSIVMNIIYNFEPCRFSSKSPLEFPCVISGFSCISLISCVLNDIPLPPAKYWIHLAAICVVVQLWTEYMDIKADGAKQRRTTAVVLGRKLTKCALGATLIATSVVVYQLFDDVLLYAFHIALLVVFAVLALLPDSMKSDRDFSPKSNGTVCASEIKPRSTTRRNTWIHVIASPIAIYLMLHLWSGGVFVLEQVNDVSSS